MSKYPESIIEIIAKHTAGDDRGEAIRKAMRELEALPDYQRWVEFQISELIGMAMGAMPSASPVAQVAGQVVLKTIFPKLPARKGQ
jgi:hypothetical protein